MQASDTSVFPVALNLSGRPVLVLGGTEEASEKVPKLIAAGAHVTLVSPEVSESLAQLARTRALTWYARDFRAQDAQGMRLVMVTEQDRALALRVRALPARPWLVAIDQPDVSDVYLMSSLRSGPVQIAISTGGRAPLLARRIRQALERALGPEFGEFARRFADLRAQLRALPRAERMQRLTGALAGFAMEVRVRYPEPDTEGAGQRPDGAP